MQQQTEKPSITYLHLDPNFLLQKSNDKQPSTQKQSANLAHYQFSESEQNLGTSYSKHANFFDFRNIPRTQTQKRKETIKSFQSSINKVNITQSDQNKSGVMVLKQCEQQYTNDSSIKQDQQRIMKQGSLDQVQKSTINLGTPFALSQEQTVVPLTHVKKDQSQITVHDLMQMKGAFIPGKTKLLTSPKVQNNIDQHQISNQKLQNKSIDQEKHFQSPNKKKYLKGIQSQQDLSPERSLIRNSLNSKDIQVSQSQQYMWRQQLFKQINPEIISKSYNFNTINHERTHSKEYSSSKKYLYLNQFGSPVDPKNFQQDFIENQNSQDRKLDDKFIQKIIRDMELKLSQHQKFTQDSQFNINTIRGSRSDFKNSILGSQPLKNYQDLNLPALKVQHMNGHVNSNSNTIDQLKLKYSLLTPEFNFISPRLNNQNSLAATPLREGVSNLDSKQLQRRNLISNQKLGLQTANSSPQNLHQISSHQTIKPQSFNRNSIHSESREIFQNINNGTSYNSLAQINGIQSQKRIIDLNNYKQSPNNSKQAKQIQLLPTVTKKNIIQIQKY